MPRRKSVAEYILKMPEKIKNTVTRALITEDEADQRLDNYLLRCCKGVPKSHIYRILRSGEVRVNGGRKDASYRTRVGDEIRIPPIRVASAPVETDIGGMLRADLPLIYEDDALLVVDKPAGIAVHGGSGVSFGVIEALRKQRPQARLLELAHRLDRETSGILLVAKKRQALVALHDMFRDGAQGRGADKRYQVLVAGDWPDVRRHVRLPLYKFLTAEGERRVRVAPDGKPSHTVFNLLARWPGYSLLEAELKTGRTHQIRVHLAHLGFPIVGDDKYGDFAKNRELQRQGLKRMFLHAWKMSLPHPLQPEQLALLAPLPPALLAFLDHLDRQSARQVFLSPADAKSNKTSS